MNYIILDFEWNNAYYKKNHAFVNEIVEIGAVKLDGKFNIIDRFSRVVRSSITKKLSGRFKELTGMTNETMLDGIPFADALNEYKLWAGEHNVTLTWSDSDLYVLYDNCIYFGSGPEDAKIGLYADLQKIFHNELVLMGTPEKNQMSLSNAAERLGITVSDEELHRAFNDSLLASKILEKCYKENIFSNFVIDTNNPEFYKKLCFKTFYVNDINSSFIDKSKLYVNCNTCGFKAKRLTKWSFKNKKFGAKFYCKNCDKKFLGFITIRKFYDSVEIRKKTVDIKDEIKA